MGWLFTDVLVESLNELFLSLSYLPGRLHTELGNWWASDHLSAVDLNTWEIYLWLIFFPSSISRTHPNSGWYCDLSRTLPLPIISTVMLHLPLFTRLSFSVLHFLVSAEWVLPPPPPRPSMAYLSICMTVCKLGHCVWRFSILERQNDNDERGVLFE